MTLSRRQVRSDAACGPGAKAEASFPGRHCASPRPATRWAQAFLLLLQDTLSPRANVSLVKGGWMWAFAVVYNP